MNHAAPNDVTEVYVADWTIEQLREPAQRITDRIEELMSVGSECIATDCMAKASSTNPLRD